MALTKTRRKISETKRVAAAAMIDLGISSRRVGEELGISHEMALQCAKDPYINSENVEMVKGRLQDRLLVASDRYLTHSLDGLNKLDPYRAMICSGIAHDHYLRSRQADRGVNAGGLTQILIQIDQGTRCSVTVPTLPADKVSD